MIDDDQAAVSARIGPVLGIAVFVPAGRFLVVDAAALGNAGKDYLASVGGEDVGGRSAVVSGERPAAPEAANIDPPVILGDPGKGIAAPPEVGGQVCRRSFHRPGDRPGQAVEITGTGGQELLDQAVQRRRFLLHLPDRSLLARDLLLQLHVDLGPAGQGALHLFLAGRGLAAHPFQLVLLLLQLRFFRFDPGSLRLYLFQEVPVVFSDDLQVIEAGQEVGE